MRKKPYQRKKGGKYYIDFYEVVAGGEKVRRTKSTGTTDFSVAKQILKEKQSLAALNKFSMPTASRHDLTLDEALDRYLQFKRAGKVSKIWEDTILRVIKQCFVEVTAIKYMNQVRDTHLEAYVSWLIEEGFADSMREKNERIVRKFLEWLHDRELIPNNPLKKVGKLTKKISKAMHRRMLLPEEVSWIEHTLETVPDKNHGSRKADSRERLACYLLAIRTGLRSSEIAALRVGDFELTGKKPKVVLEGRFTKNGLLAIQYLDMKIAARIKKHFKVNSRKAADLAFNLPDRQRRSEMLRRDFATARKVWEDETGGKGSEDFLSTCNSKGEVINFHCLRHTCGAWLAQSGINPKTIQSIMRHSSIKLTMDTYGHLFPDAEADAVHKTAFFSSNSRNEIFK